MRRATRLCRSSFSIAFLSQDEHSGFVGGSTVRAVAVGVGTISYEDAEQGMDGGAFAADNLSVVVVLVHASVASWIASEFFVGSADLALSTFGDGMFDADV